MSKKLLVIDSSVIIKWLSSDNEISLDKANAILTDAQNRKVDLLVPELAKYEVGNVLLLGKHLSPQQANLSLVQFFALPLTFITESENMAQETFTLAFVNKITYYDASFLSLAKQYKATLVTENIKHQGRSFEVKAIALKDY